MLEEGAKTADQYLSLLRDAVNDCTLSSFVLRRFVVLRRCRTENGLPENRIVYACSNQLYKYDPETFNSW